MTDTLTAHTLGDLRGEEETTELFVGDRWIPYPFGREVAIAYSPRHQLDEGKRARLNAFLASWRALR